MVKQFTLNLQSRRNARHLKECFDSLKGLLTVKRMNEVVCNRIVQMRLCKVFTEMRQTLAMQKRFRASVSQQIDNL